MPWSGARQAPAAASACSKTIGSIVLGHALPRLRVDVDRVEEGAVDVVLALLVGGVPDPDRLRADVSVQVVERPLRQLRLAPDPEHDLRLGAATVAEMRDELHELARLLVEADHVQAPEREARVPDPGVAVVPVPLPARGLGKRGRQGGDHRPGRLVGEALERERRALQSPAPRVIRKVPALQPAPPQVDRSLDEPDRVGGIGWPAELLAPGQAHEGALAGLERAHAAGDPAVQLQGDVPEQSHRLSAAARVRGEPFLVHQAPARLLGRVVKGGLADRLDLDRPMDALDRAQEHVLGVQRTEPTGAHALAVLDRSAEQVRARRGRPSSRWGSSSSSRARSSPACTASQPVPATRWDRVERRPRRGRAGPRTRSASRSGAGKATRPFRPKPQAPRCGSPIGSRSRRSRETAPRRRLARRPRPVCCHCHLDRKAQLSLRMHGRVADRRRLDRAGLRADPVRGARAHARRLGGSLLARGELLHGRARRRTRSARTSLTSTSSCFARAG